MLICEGVLPFQEVKVFRFPGVKARWIGDCTYRRHGSPEWCGATQRRWGLDGGEKVTPWKINMEATNHPFLKGKSYGGVCNHPEKKSESYSESQAGFHVARWKILHG